jgi:hypothetical protein
VALAQTSADPSATLPIAVAVLARFSGRSLGLKEQGESFHLPEYSGEVYILMGRPLP